MSQPHTGAHQTHTSKIRWWWWVLSGSLAFVGFVALVLWLSATNNPQGKPWLENPTSLVIALLALVGSLISVLVPKLSRINTNSAQTAQHVVNSHSGRILRDDIDQIKTMLGHVADTQLHQGRDILGMREELGQIRGAQREQWQAIEDTNSKLRKDKQ